MLAFILLVVVVLSGSNGSPIPRSHAEGGKCNPHDLNVYQKHGNEFPRRFRQYAGMFVTRSQYIESLHKYEGLSTPCAECYGDAYICGWTNCKMDCVSQDKICNKCLRENDCTQKCDACTGFPPLV